MTRWLLHETFDRSLERAAANVKAPEDLDSDALVKEGAAHYAKVCVVCHLAPGVDSTGTRAGLNPRPPRLSRSVTDMSAGELFWITRHGAKMTGMPAWGPSHSDDEIWAIVAFVRKLPGMTPEQYRLLLSADAMGSRDDATPQ